MSAKGNNSIAFISYPIYEVHMGLQKMFRIQLHLIKSTQKVFIAHEV